MSSKMHGKRIIGLLVLAALVQTCAVMRNPVPAQDAIGFIHFARQLDYHSLADTLRSNSLHPLFPILVWGQQSLVTWLFGSHPDWWVRSAQIVAAVASILVVIPMYLIGTRLGTAGRATAAAALFSTLPLVTRLGADALGDSTYLLFMFGALWACVEYLRCRRVVLLFVTGLAVGIAYLGRPEAMLLPVALGAMLMLLQLRPAERMGWGAMSGAVASALAGFICIAAPYTVAIGKLTPKGSLRYVPGGASLFARFDTNLGRPVLRTFSDGQSVTAPPARVELAPDSRSTLDFSLSHRPDDKRRTGYMAAGYEFVRELAEGLNYFLVPLLVVGVVFFERTPASLLCAILATGSAASIVQFASKAGYISSRHVLTLVALSCFAAAHGGWLVAGWLARRWSRRRAMVATPVMMEVIERWQRRFAIGLVAVLALAGLPRGLGALHRSRSAHVAAGLWLNQHAEGGSIVLDSRGWASLYSGLPAYDYNGARLAFEDPSLAFVVVESEEVADARPRGETLRHLLGVAGQLVAEFPAPGTGTESVQVFAWHPERLERAPVVDRSVRAN
jgi:hypothetical protein